MHMPASCRCCGWACKLLVDVGPISRTFLPLLRDRDVYVTPYRAVEMKENINELVERYSHEYGRRRIGKLRFPKGWGQSLLSFSLFRKQPDCLTACGRTVDCHEGISWGYRYVAWAVGAGTVVGLRGTSVLVAQSNGDSVAGASMLVKSHQMSALWAFSAPSSFRFALLFVRGEIQIRA
ncbi:hypothetical protein BDP81DRAFT_179707 [Colletotrichum phormii]|uniref:Uncharacterized protein n=1 Tax=Colletotrichum phormii TaxID=359342 RepID=A0AAI9ZZ33_9PEZI|nr:uncharacterized protein BDP81DRAFT_179707 [Colletotrichum phormii]KAK1639573.1 hypothetical protein BDP81DRAFT_179707 [Colletotrichum phormii]